MCASGERATREVDRPLRDGPDPAAGTAVLLILFGMRLAVVGGAPRGGAARGATAQRASLTAGVTRCRL